MKKESGYAGKISHSGAQVVKGPFASKGKGKSGGHVIRGTDLRAGKDGKK